MVSMGRDVSQRGSVLYLCSRSRMAPGMWRKGESPWKRFVEKTQAQNRSIADAQVQSDLCAVHVRKTCQGVAEKEKVSSL
jgi:hypothetical protein